MQQAHCLHLYIVSKLTKHVCVPAGLAFWDVYKVAPLDSLQPKKVETDQVESSVQRSAAVSSKASRVQHAVHSASKLPTSFSSNSPKEEAMLAYLADLQRAFQELYPHRCCDVHLKLVVHTVPCACNVLWHLFCSTSEGLSLVLLRAASVTLESLLPRTTESSQSSCAAGGPCH